MNERIIGILASSFKEILLMGLKVTIPLTLLSFFFGFIIALIVALTRVSKIKVLSQIASIYVWIFRGTPLIVQLFIIFYGLPAMGIVLDDFPSAVIGFSLNVGAYASETIRASILAIPEGQYEAGYVVGMPYHKIMFRIILPQALRISFLPLFNSFIGLVKDTSLAASITLPEMFLSAQRIAAVTFEPFWLYIETAFIYLLFCSILTAIQYYLEKNYSKNR